MSRGRSSGRSSYRGRSNGRVVGVSRVGVVGRVGGKLQGKEVVGEVVVVE